MIRITPSLHFHRGLALLGLVSVVFLGVGAVTVSCAVEKPDNKAVDAKSYTGTLRTGVMAIGGETTGITLTTADSGVYELDFGTDKELKKKAESLNGKKVIVVGDYQPRAGVEIKERRIIAARSLRAAD